jgi:hypothetical protein
MTKNKKNPKSFEDFELAKSSLTVVPSQDLEKEVEEELDKETNEEEAQAALKKYDPKYSA